MDRPGQEGGRRGRRRFFWLYLAGMALLGVLAAGWILKGGPLPAVEWAFEGLVEFFAVIVRGLGG